MPAEVRWFLDMWRDQRKLCSRCNGYYLRIGKCERCENLTAGQVSAAVFVVRLGATWDADGTITCCAEDLESLVRKTLDEAADLVIAARAAGGY